MDPIDAIKHHISPTNLLFNLLLKNKDKKIINVDNME